MVARRSPSRCYWIPLILGAKVASRSRTEGESGGFDLRGINDEVGTNYAPEALDSLGPEERHRLYGMLRLKVLWFEDSEAWAEMPIRPLASLEEDPGVYRTGVTSKSARTAAR